MAKYKRFIRYDRPDGKGLWYTKDSFLVKEGVIPITLDHKLRQTRAVVPFSVRDDGVYIDIEGLELDNSRPLTSFSISYDTNSIELLDDNRKLVKHGTLTEVSLVRAGAMVDIPLNEREVVYNSFFDEGEGEPSEVSQLTQNQTTIEDTIMSESISEGKEKDGEIINPISSNEPEIVKVDGDETQTSQNSAPEIRKPKVTAERAARTKVSEVTETYQAKRETALSKVDKWIKEAHGRPIDLLQKLDNAEEIGYTQTLMANSVNSMASTDVKDPHVSIIAGLYGLSEPKHEIFNDIIWASTGGNSFVTQSFVQAKTLVSPILSSLDAQAKRQDYEATNRQVQLQMYAVMSEINFATLHQLPGEDLLGRIQAEALKHMKKELSKTIYTQLRDVNINPEVRQLVTPSISIQDPDLYDVLMEAIMQASIYDDIEPTRVYMHPSRMNELRGRNGANRINRAPTIINPGVNVYQLEGTSLVVVFTNLIGADDFLVVDDKHIGGSAQSQAFTADTINRVGQGASVSADGFLQGGGVDWLNRKLYTFLQIVAKAYTRESKNGCVIYDNFPDAITKLKGNISP